MPIFIKPKDRVLYLLSSVEVNLADWIIAQGVVKGDVRVIIPVGEIIGSATRNVYALNVGNIDPFDSVTLDVLGEIQGRGGKALASLGGNAVYSARPITINVSGAIRGGGGAGGIGGKGGSGNDALNWTAYRYNVSTDYYRYDGQDIYWAGAPRGGTNKTYQINSGDIYQGGSSQGSSKYQIRQGDLCTQNGGAGGTAGIGQGYMQTNTAGGIGVAGLCRAGDGGNGGDGGTWGLSGAAGASGANGVKISSGEDGNVTYGTSGLSGDLGGYSIFTLDGPTTGVIVNNTGTMNGRTYY